MNNKKFNGFESEEQYLSIFNTLKEIQENNDTYNRDTMMVYKIDNYIEFILDYYSINIFGEWNVEVCINRGKEGLVDNGIMNVCWKILEMIKDGEFEFDF